MSYRILSANGAIGYSFPVESIESACREKVDLIADDAGSMDPGPYYLGAGESAFKKGSIKRDFEILMRAARKLKCPILLGSCGLSGDRPHVQFMVDIVKDVFEEQGISGIKVAVVDSHVDPDLVVQHLNALKPLGKMPPLTREAVRESKIVAAMGIAPYITALDEGADVVLCGRSCDVAIFAADPVRRGWDAGIAYHTGHVLECGAIACDPGSASDCLIAELREDDSVIFTPPNETRRATSYSVAAHSLYEESHPALQTYPEGILTMEHTEYFDAAPRSAGIRKSQFVHKPLSIKLEGSRRIGHRVVSFLPLDPAKLSTADPLPDQHLVYGISGVEKERLLPGEREIGIVLTVEGADHEDVASLAATLKGYLLHYGYPGRITTAGNVSFPISPLEMVHTLETGRYRGVVICGTREPLFINQKDDILKNIVRLGTEQFPELMKKCDVEFATFDNEHPLLLLETIQPTKAQAKIAHEKALETVGGYVNPAAKAYRNIDAGDAYIWSVYHIWNDAEAIKKHLFPIRIYEADGKNWKLVKECMPVYKDIGARDYTGSLDERKLFLIHEVPHDTAPACSRPVRDMVRILRSKDAGVNTLTYDLFFNSEKEYRQALESNMFTVASIAATLGVPKSDVIGTYSCDSANAIKISRFRRMIAGTPGSPDTFGAQQHMRIEKMVVPIYHP